MKGRENLLPDMLKRFNVSPNTEKEVFKFEKFLRLVSEAERAGLTREEAMHAIYPDVYDD